ncbi:hypothetical protein TorRG33x02_204840, partial [Trema orientale]
MLDSSSEPILSEVHALESYAPTNQALEGCRSPCGWTGYYPTKNPDAIFSVEPILS